jgi:hypothetical protein
MTEIEWLACQNAEEMRWQLRYYSRDNPLSERKLRLYGCACCRQIWHNLVDPRSKTAVEAAEQFADGGPEEDQAPLESDDEEEVIPMEQRQMSRVQFERLDAAHRTELSAAWAAWAVNRVDDGWDYYDHLEDVISHCLEAADAQAFGPTRDALACIFADLLRDIAGNPFRSIVIDPSIFTPAVISLAQAAYDNRDLPSGTLESARLGVLADALEEAGCTEQAIFDHLRSHGPHVRGCWPVDLILGKQ